MIYDIFISLNVVVDTHVHKFLLQAICNRVV